MEGNPIGLESWVSSRSQSVYVFLTCFKLCFVVYISFRVTLQILQYHLFFILPYGLILILIFILFSKLKLAKPPAQITTAMLGPSVTPSREEEPSNYQCIDSHYRQQLHSYVPGPLLVIGHRGCGADVPENSLSAFRQCASKGVEAVEFDVALTKDFVPVIFRDDNLLRMCGIDRDLNDITWTELQTLDISLHHPAGAQFRGERVPSLEQALQCCFKLGLKVVIDLKDLGEHNQKLVDAIVSAFHLHPDMYSKALVTSFYIHLIYKIRSRDTNIIGAVGYRPGFFRYTWWGPTWSDLKIKHDKSFLPDFYLWTKDTLNEFAVRKILWWLCGLSVIFVHKDSFLTKESSFRWIQKGIRVYAAVVNCPLEKLHLVQNVNVGYMTDTVNLT